MYVADHQGTNEAAGIDSVNAPTQYATRVPSQRKRMKLAGAAAQLEEIVEEVRWR